MMVTYLSLVVYIQYVYTLYTHVCLTRELGKCVITSFCMCVCVCVPSTQKAFYLRVYYTRYLYESFYRFVHIYVYKKIGRFLSGC